MALVQEGKICWIIRLSSSKLDQVSTDDASVGLRYDLFRSLLGLWYVTDIRNVMSTEVSCRAAQLTNCVPELLAQDSCKCWVGTLCCILAARSTLHRSIRVTLDTVHTKGANSTAAQKSASSVVFLILRTSSYAVIERNDSTGRWGEKLRLGVTVTYCHCGKV